MEIAKIIKSRWSPRAFTNQSITKEEVELLFEAARWAPSSMNEQPWKYYYVLRDNTDQFNKFIDCLLPGNQVWAKNASLLILSTTRKFFNHKGKANRHAMHDIGAANLLICLQADEMGYQAHQMGGFNPEKTYETFGIDREEYDIASFIAVGKPGNPDILPENLKKSEQEPRKRKKTAEFVKEIR